MAEYIYRMESVRHAEEVEQFLRRLIDADSKSENMIIQKLGVSGKVYNFDSSYLKGFQEEYGKEFSPTLWFDFWLLSESLRQN